jgi:hypothetical protein
MIKIAHIALVLGAATLPVALASNLERFSELRIVIDRLTATPSLQAAPGFAVKTWVSPGQLYDPLEMVARNGRIWLNDIGGELGERGGRIYTLSRSGRLDVAVELGQMLPPTGFDFAPPGFGDFAGDILALTQPRVSMPGLGAAHLIQRIRPWTGEPATTVCELPAHGHNNGGIAGIGVEARFGPEAGPFANRLFAVTFGNNTIYQMTADGRCAAFVNFDAEQWGGPSGIAFTPDGQEMLVSVARGSTFDPEYSTEGAILRVDALGRIKGEPYAVGFRRPTAMAFAPPHFGAYGNTLFVADAGNPQIPVPMTQPMTADGRVLVVGPDRQPRVVASGFATPGGLLFVDGTLLVSDLNGNFVGGRRELPEGFIARIKVAR